MDHVPRDSRPLASLGVTFLKEDNWPLDGGRIAINPPRLPNSGANRSVAHGLGCSPIRYNYLTKLSWGAQATALLGSYSALESTLSRFKATDTRALSQLRKLGNGTGQLLH